MANNGSSDQFHVESNPGKMYELSGKIMLSAIVILFAVVVFMVGFHLYARWYLIRLRRRQLEHRRARRSGGRRHIVVHVDNQRQAAAPVVDRGLEKTVLNSLPVYVYSSKTEQPPECAVCLSEFEEKEVVRHLPKCSHSFHIECIDMWFHSHSTCPLCRAPVEPVVNRVETVIETENSKNLIPFEHGSSSGDAENVSSQAGEESGKVETTLYGGRRKGLDLGVSIEVPPRRADLDDELAQISTGFISPGNRLKSLKRIISTSIKSTVSGFGSRCEPLVDLEIGQSARSQGSSRVHTPR